MLSLFTASGIVPWGLLGQVQLLCMMFSSEILKVPSVFEILNTKAPKVLSQKNNTGLHKMEPLAGLAKREFN